MSAINRVTLGLLSLLDSKTQGQNPNDMPNIIQATLDVAPYLYGSQRLEFEQNSNAAVIANGTYAPVTVPAGEIWLMQAVTSEVVANDSLANNTVRMWPELLVNVVSQPFPIMETPAAVHAISVVTQASVTTCNWRHPGLPIAGGSTFQTRVGQITPLQVAGVLITTTVLFIRLKV